MISIKPTCVIIDDEQLAIDRLKGLLELDGQLDILFTQTHPEKALEQIKQHRPEIIFIDVEMPRMTGFDVVNQTRSHPYNPTYIFVTAFNQYAIKAIKSEAFDFLVKPVDVDELRECIARYHRKQQNIPELQNNTLTPREKEIAQLVAQGKTSQQIADLLFLSKHTVDTHPRKIRGKV